MAQQNIMDVLPHLPAEQLRSIRDQVTVLLAIGGKGAKAGPDVRGNAADDFARDLYEALAAELQRRTRAKSMPFSLFAGSNQYETHFKAAARNAMDANALWFPKQSRAERMSMVQLYAKLALDYLAGQSRPMVWYNIAAAMNALPQVVDGAFPGYASAGLLGKVQALRTRRSSPSV